MNADHIGKAAAVMLAVSGIALEVKAAPAVNQTHGSLTIITEKHLLLCPRLPL